VGSICPAGHERVKEVQWKGAGRIHLAQVRNKSWALLNTVMNLPVPQREVNFLMVKELAIHEGLCSMC
jgi:hypothetical protein